MRPRERKHVSYPIRTGERWFSVAEESERSRGGRIDCVEGLPELAGEAFGFSRILGVSADAQALNSRVHIPADLRAPDILMTRSQTRARSEEAAPAVRAPFVPGAHARKSLLTFATGRANGSAGGATKNADCPAARNNAPSACNITRLTIPNQSAN